MRGAMVRAEELAREIQTSRIVLQPFSNRANARHARSSTTAREIWEDTRGARSNSWSCPVGSGGTAAGCLQCLLRGASRRRSRWWAVEPAFELRGARAASRRVSTGSPGIGCRIRARDPRRERTSHECRAGDRRAGLPGPARPRAAAGDPRGSRVIQFTPDLMPSDITGTDASSTRRPRPGERSFKFQQGPIFANVCARRRDQPHAAQDAGRAARGDAGAAGHRRGERTSCPARSSCSRRRTRSSRRAPTRCPRRSSTASCAGMLAALRHRIVLGFEAEAEGVQVADLIDGWRRQAQATLPG
jgi:hypothetical protein